MSRPARTRCAVPGLTRRRFYGGAAMAGQLIQVVGALLILAPFGLAQLGRLDARSKTSLLLNLAGSATLAGDAAVGSQWGVLLVRGAWVIVSAFGLLRRPRSGLEARGACRQHRMIRKGDGRQQDDVAPRWPA